MAKGTNVSTDNIIDIDLSATRKKRIRINGDDSKILELNLSDMNIVSRLNETLPKLTELEGKYADLGTNVEDLTEEEFLDSFSESLAHIDAEMRELVDYLFNSNVSELCAADGSMYDPFDGTFRCEYIISTLIQLYETNVTDEFTKMNNKLKAKTAKYTKKGK